MAYYGNNYLIPNYQWQQNQLYQPTAPIQTPQQAQDERIWVSGEHSAEAYLVAPNGFVRLWDTQNPVFYEKRADQTGRPYPMEIFEYHRKGGDPKPQIPGPVDYSDDIKEIKRRLAELEKEMNSNVPKSTADDATV